MNINRYERRKPKDGKYVIYLIYGFKSKNDSDWDFDNPDYRYVGITRIRKSSGWIYPNRWAIDNLGRRIRIRAEDDYRRPRRECNDGPWVEDESVNGCFAAERRLKEHLNDRKKRKTPLQNAMYRYANLRPSGYSNFKVQPLEVVENRKTALKKEKMYIVAENANLNRSSTKTLEGKLFLMEEMIKSLIKDYKGGSQTIDRYLSRMI